MKSEGKKQSIDNYLEAYWSQRYIDNSTGWDLGNISEPIRSYIDQLNDKSIPILIPGAGNSYEAEYMWHLGFKNTYIMDISEIPIKNFKDRVPDFPEDQLLKTDFFSFNGQFDLIIEQTFFCSFPPIDNNRENYVIKMHDLLKPKGKLVGLWFNMPFTGDLNKRPFGATESEYTKLFKNHFEFKIFEESYNSVPDRLGMEFFGILQKRPDLIK